MPAPWRADPASTAPIESSQLAQLIVIYGTGYVAVFVVFLVMYLYALRRRHLLHLTRLDLFDARYAIEAYVINIGTGLGSIAAGNAWRPERPPPPRPRALGSCADYGRQGSAQGGNPG